MFLLFGINLRGPGCCRMQGSLSAVSLMFAPCDPHLTFPHLSLHKINPFLAPPHLTSLRPHTSGPQQIKSNTHATDLTDTTTSNTILSTQLKFFCTVHFLKGLSFLPSYYSHFIGLNFLFGSGGRRICFGQFLWKCLYHLFSCNWHEGLCLSCVTCCSKRICVFVYLRC